MPSEKSTSSTNSVQTSLSDLSETSTLIYGQAPFSEYSSVVQKLCRHLWPSATEDFEIERLKGGGFNRVIGITAPDRVSQAPAQYILRIPRFEDTRPDRELAIHRYVQEHTSIPTAEIFFFDLTNENILEKPYVIQKRIPGNSLFQIYNTLDQERKRDIARQWGHILLEEQTITNDTSGVVEAIENKDGTLTYSVSPFGLDPALDDESIHVDIASDRTVLKMFVTQFSRWSACDLQLDPENIYAEETLAQLSDIAIEMDAAGLFEDKHFYLSHLDLEPRNVLVDTGHDDSILISGVLDWDSAVFAPIFVSCMPPSWIWAWYDNETNEEEVEAKANEIPEDPDRRELKQIFEETVGPAYLVYAYHPQYRLARKLFKLAKDGLRSCWANDFVQSVPEEWAEMKATLNLRNASTTSAGDVLDEAEIGDSLGTDSHCKVVEEIQQDDQETGVNGSESPSTTKGMPAEGGDKYTKEKAPPPDLRQDKGVDGGTALDDK
ncbi:MAG: hypothetical protein LQ343_007853 [Gyalolechia ehrenbergii]|nr:MAG: hypothetical protein LQ343_007853 [Gyalolechia ehrenbergii]